MGAPFERLQVYQRATRLSDDIRVSVLRWGLVDTQTLGMQIIRAADSVHANIAEATGRWTLADQTRILLIARGSLYELQGFITRAEYRGLPLQIDARMRADEIGRMLNGPIRATRRGKGLKK